MFCRRNRYNNIDDNNNARDLTPLHVLKNNLQQFNRDPNNKQNGVTPVVLVSTGALCPVHTAHVNIFSAAKRYLESQHKFAVVGAFLSPSHDAYVSSKLGGDHIPAVHRTKMVELAIADAGLSDWLSVDRWESLGVSMFVDFPNVVERMDNLLREKFPHENIRVMYLCGADHVMRTIGPNSILSKIGGVVCVGRPEWTDRLRERLNNGDMKSWCFVAEDPAYVESGVSSTQIRERLAQGKPIDDLTFPSVRKYIADNKIYHHQQQQQQQQQQQPHASN